MREHDKSMCSPIDGSKNMTIIVYKKNRFTLYKSKTVFLKL